MEIRLVPILGVPEVKEECFIGEVLLKSIKENNIEIENNDIICIASKIVSISEKRIKSLKNIIPTDLAYQIKEKVPRKDIRVLQLIIDESFTKDMRSLLVKNNYIGSKLESGLILTSGGIDSFSENEVVLLPENADESAKKIGKYIENKTQKEISVIITDSEGREDKIGATQVAIGFYGINPIRETVSSVNDKKKVSQETLCDMVASAAGLLMGQRGTGIPFVVIKNLEYERNVEVSIKNAVTKK